MKPMTRDEIDRLQQSGAPMPNRFTGVWKGQHYYMGVRWFGPSNLMGFGGRLKQVEDGGVAPVG